MDGLATFVINLDDAADRLAQTAQHLDAADFPFSRISAVRGDAAPADVAMAHMGRDLLPGERGCFQSHRNAAQAFLDSDADLGLVLEDDVALGPAAVQTLRSLLANRDNFAVWDIMNLGAPAKRWRTPVRSSVYSGPGVLCHAHQFPVTTTALLWSRGGAQMFLMQCRDMQYPVDVQLQDWVAKTGRGLAFEQAPFGARDEGSMISGTGAKRSHAAAFGYTWKRLKRQARVHWAARQHQKHSGYSG